MSLEDRAVVNLIEHGAPRMIGHIRNLTPKIPARLNHKQKTQMRRCEHDNELDEEIKTVSARQAEVFGVLYEQFALCCRPKFIMKLITQKLSSVLFCPALTR